MAAATGEAIAVSDVDKVYKGGVHALRGVDLTVLRGEVFGLLGPNGAGKSTLIKILMTVIRPTRCVGHMLDHSVGHKPTLARVGYLPEHHSFPGYLTGEQVLDFYAAMTGMKRRERKARLGAMLELVSMRDWAKDRVRSYSKGMRQRIGIAQALMHDPDLVLLDEPTDGVDPVGRRDIRDIVMRLKDEGRAVFLNSHLLSELEMVTDRVSILVQGKVAMQGTIDELTRDKRRYEIELDALSEMGGAGDEGGAGDARLAAARRAAAVLPGPAREDELMIQPQSSGRQSSSPPTSPGGEFGRGQIAQTGRRIGLVGELPSGERVEVDGSTIRVWTEEPKTMEPIVDAARRAGMTIRSLRPVRPSLEELFIDAVTNLRTGETLKPGAVSDKKRRRGTKASSEGGGSDASAGAGAGASAGGER